MTAPSQDRVLQPEGREFYRRVVTLLLEDRVPFLVGGAYAFERHTGIARHTRDFDLFVRPEDARGVLERCARAGYATELTFPHWLGKVREGDYYVDIIYSSGNGVARVDQGWFDHAEPGTVLDHDVLLCPAEEMIWSKAFIMERERFDGGDIAHLLRARAATLDWSRLVARFGIHARVLLVHLILFGYIYPDRRDQIPRAVMSSLLERLDEPVPITPGEPPCFGTFLSRSQYLPDLRWGCRDPRLPPYGTMTASQIETWTEAAETPEPEWDPEHEATGNDATPAPRPARRGTRRGARPNGRR
jgi:hypothetical protein